jgi:hypothetical protein
MLHNKLVCLFGAFVLALAGTQGASAQSAPDGGRSDSDRASGTITGERVLPGRLGARADQDEELEPRERSNTRSARRPAQAAAPTTEQLLAMAQAQLAASGRTCQLSEAVLLGRDAQQQGIFEVACANAPGYIIVASTPPLAVDCLELAGTAATARLRDPAADVGQQCSLPANNNGLAVIGGWAKDAGATCTVDQAVAIGKSSGGNMIYEVGCAGQDGYWLEKTASGWDLQDCLQVVASNGTCNFTTTEEQAASFSGKLAGTDAAGCSVQAVRLMGENANGRFYEAKCAAGDGYIARVNAEGVTQQVYPCATAQTIGGGCRLTTASPAPAAAPATID